MTPINTHIGEAQDTEEIEMERIHTEDEARRLSPLTQSASSTLRDDLARFQHQEWSRYQEAINRTRRPMGRPAQQLTLTPIYSECYFPWQPPMAPPPTPPHPTEPPPEPPKTHRRRMNMRVNLPLPEDQPPKKLSRQNSRAGQVESQNTAETGHQARCCTMSHMAQDQETEVHETSLPTPQRPYGPPQSEATEQANQDNIPELFKTIANRKI